MKLTDGTLMMDDNNIVLNGFSSIFKFFSKISLIISFTNFNQNFSIFHDFISIALNVEVIPVFELSFPLFPA